MVIANTVSQLQLGAEAVTSMYMGEVPVWPVSYVDYDSLVTRETIGPLGAWDDPGTSHMQEWTPEFKQGIAFTTNENVYVHGARWWKPGTSTGINPGNDLTLYFGQDVVDSIATNSKVYDGTWNPSEARWVTVLFDEPVYMASGATRILYMNVTTGGNVFVARWAAYWPAGQESRYGLFSLPDAEGRFIIDYAPAYAHNVVPSGTVDAWYWIDPLVLATDDLPPAQSVFFEAGERYTLPHAGLSAGDYTVCMWVNQTTNRVANQFFLSGVGGTWTLVGVNNTNTLVWDTAAGMINTGEVFVTGTWYFVAVTYRAASTEIVYWAEEGETLSSTTGIATAIADAHTVYIPSEFDYDRFEGRVAQVKMWTAALSQAELEAEMAAAHVVRTSNLYSYYSFKDGPQTTDESGNGHTLTLVTGTPSIGEGPPVV